MTEVFFWVWVALTVFCALQFVWACVRQWEIGILVPIYLFCVGSVVWWVLYLVLDKIGQHVTIH